MRSSAQAPRPEEALRMIVGAASDRADLLSPSGYRSLRDRSGSELPAPDAIWEMFGSFQRMRELALTVNAGEADDTLSSSAAVQSVRAG